MKLLVHGSVVLLLVAPITRVSSNRHTHPQLHAVMDTVACSDTLHANDTIPAIVKIAVHHQDTTSTLPTNFEALFADEFQSRFKAPSQLPLITIDADQPCKGSVCASASPLVRVDAYAMALQDGTMQKISVISPSLNTELADSVRSVLTAMSSERTVPFFESAVPLPIRIIVSTETAPDSVPPPRRLFRAKLPHYTAEYRQPSTVRKPVFPRYPRPAEMNGVGDALVFEFTILPDGKVAPESVDLVQYHHPEFVQALIDAFPKMVFEPAMLGSCKVPVWVTQKFDFKSYMAGHDP